MNGKDRAGRRKALSKGILKGHKSAWAAWMEKRECRPDF